MTDKMSIWKKLVYSLVTFVFVLAVFYLFLAYYYRDSFSFGTWINGVYCTGKTIDEIDQELLSNRKTPIFTILLKNGTTVSLNAEAFDYRENYKNILQSELESQNSFFWGSNLFQSNSKILLPEISCNMEELKDLLDREAFIKMNQHTSSPKVKIMESDKGFELFDNTDSILNYEYATAKIITSILAGENRIELDDGLSYEKIEITPDMLKTYQLWEKVKEFQDFRIRYLFGDTEEILDSSVVADWITIDSDGNFILDENGDLILNQEMVKEYVASLASKYDTLGGTRIFQATRGEMVTIEGGTYGNQLDQETETEYLINAFLQNNDADRIPVYIKSAKKQGSDDIGDTYIEIDMTEQTLYYYEKNELKVLTPVVTGNLKYGRETPARVCYVYAKQKNRILRGPGYAAHVNFWMPVYGNIGIHDAKWRDEFGGNIYKTDGSHGCINTPFDTMKQLFDIVEIGTPVIMYY
ncbi:MAG: L,D-transpeptidase family protein [Lachnospiraceae bacterium]|nr:L,D-transpeptidase family protein [Lachnospiraceae bacterium]MDD3660405.1 L,D-transpeptidase family protein [Lachnospiraceae bacterium]